MKLKEGYFLGLIFFFVIIVLISFSSNPVVLALDTYPDCPDAITYYTSHYQSGTGLTCPVPWSFPEWDQPFYSCSCWIDPHDYTCQKAVGVSCENQAVSNDNVRYWNNQQTNRCSKYGDCCGCSGQPRRKPFPTSSPRPTPTIGPKCGCYHKCNNNSDCKVGLVCGYNIKVGKRICHNPACASEKDCRCSWQ